MAVVLLDEYEFRDRRDFRLAELEVAPILGPAELLEVSYDLLRRVFDPAVVDPLDFVLEALTPAELNHRDVRPILLAACFSNAGDTLVAGCCSATLMRLRQSTKLGILAVGNIAASPYLKSIGFRGIGSSLLNASFDYAMNLVEEMICTLSYAVAEAESDSLGFWVKHEFRWPQGVEYLQPPLEFDVSGKPVYGEVPELLVIRPFPPSPSDTIDGPIVEDIVATIYENWSLRPNRSRLTTAAMRTAEQYVRDRVFAKTAASIPDSGAIPLCDPPPAP